MSQTQEASRPCAAWPKDALRTSFGLIWLVDAVLKWLPGFRAGYMDTIMARPRASRAGSGHGSTSGSTCSTRERHSSPTLSPASAGMHAATLTFTATTPGTYRYLCPVPGHAAEGMTGKLIITSR